MTHTRSYPATNLDIAPLFSFIFSDSQNILPKTVLPAVR